MSPYVSGKLDKLLQSPETNSYKDLYPTPNRNWYYAVTMVNGEGQEEKTVDSKKVRFKNSSSHVYNGSLFEKWFSTVTPCGLFRSHVAEEKREAWTKRAWGVMVRNKAKGREFPPLFPFPLPLALPLTERRLGTSEVISQSSQQIGVPVSLLVITWQKASPLLIGHPGNYMAVVVINIPKQHQRQFQNMSPNSVPSKRRKSSGYMYTRS